MEDFDIKEEQPGCWLAKREGLQIAAVGDDAKIFHRRAIKVRPGLPGQTEVTTLLIAQLGDVKMYFQDGTIVLTREEIYP